MDIVKQDIECSDKAANDLVEKQYKEHMRELKARIKSCSKEELEVIAEVIGDVDITILLGAVYVVDYKKEKTIEKFKTALEAEDA